MQESMYDHAEDFKQHKSVKIIRMEIYSENSLNKPRGFSITYLLDGYKTAVKTYLDKLHPKESLQRHVLDVKSNENIKSIEYYRDNIGIKWIKVGVSD